MYTESVLLESRSLRTDLGHKVEVLDKVKALALSADGIHATTRDVAEYFEVGEQVVYNLLSRHREELDSNGLEVLRGDDLRKYQTLKMSVSNEGRQSYPQRRNSLAVYTRRTILNVAMLLRDSEIAQRVRAYLLDVEERARTTPASGPGPEHAALDRRVTNVESAVSHIGSVLQEVGPVIGRMSVRLERVDNRLAEMERRQVSTERVVGAMSQRLADMGEDMRTMRGDINRLARTRQPRRGR